MINVNDLSVDNVVWEIKRVECEECCRESVEIFVKVVSCNKSFYVTNTYDEKDALAFISTLKKAGITNANTGGL